MHQTPKMTSESGTNDLDDAGAPPSAAENIQLQMLAQMNAMFKEFHELTMEVRGIGQRVSAIEHPVGQSNQHQAAANVANGTAVIHEQLGVSKIIQPQVLPLQNMRSASATSWNGPASSQLSSANILTQKPFKLPRFTGIVSQWPIFISAFLQSTAAFGYSDLIYISSDYKSV